VTWNFKHILNPHLQIKIADTRRDIWYNPHFNDAEVLLLRRLPAIRSGVLVYSSDAEQTR